MYAYDLIKGVVTSKLTTTPDLRYAISDGPAWWDLRAGQCTPLPTDAEPITGTSIEVTAVAISTDGRQAAIGYENGTVRVWELKDSPQDAGRVSAHAMGVHGLAFLPGGILASASGDRTVAVWDTSTGHELARAAFSAPLRCLAASGDRILAGDAKGSLYYCRWREPHQPLEPHLRPEGGHRWSQ